MYLKSIEMVGFKSFADKTTIELKEGISAIVGPNGCGKSNIVDALRWSLGEMSAKSLRSKQMLDVIFSGSAGRAPVNLSEVTLTFDNSHHLLPIDYTEVQVSRRLFRSGESQYFLNKTQCRLKDIRDLFLDTGMTEGYSILAQGEVDFVMNAKPEERRELFEEAAGISKYKVRRDETLRKLEKVEIDINRLNDVIAMSKEQMDALDSAAKKAKLYQKLRDELKNLEMTDLVYQLDKLEEQIQTTEKRMDELKMQMQQSTVNLDCKEAELVQNRLQQDEYEKQIYDQNKSIFEIDGQITAAEHDLQSAAERETEHIQNEKRYVELIKQYEEDTSVFRKRLEEIQAENQSLNEQSQRLIKFLEKQKKEWEQFEAERKELETTKNKTSETLFEIAREISETQNERNGSASRVIHKESELIAIKKQLEKKNEEQKQLNQTVESLTQNIQQAEQVLTDNEKECQALQEKMALEQIKEKALSDKNVILRHKIVQYETQYASLIQSFEENPYKKGTQAILKQGFPGLHGVVGLLLKYSENMAQWVESALGHKINYLVFEHLHEAQTALDWLKENRMGRAICIILEKIPAVHVPDLSYIPNANSLLTFVQSAPELEKLKKYLLGSAFLAGTTLYDAGTIDGGSDVYPVEISQQGANPEIPSEDKKLSLSQNQFLVQKKLGSEIKQTTEDLKSAEQEIVAVASSIQEIKTILSEKGAILEKSRIQKIHFEEVLDAKNGELVVCCREIELDKENNDVIVKEMALLSETMRQMDEKINLLTASQKEKEESREDLQKMIEEKQTQEHDAQLLLKESEVRSELLQTHISKNESALEELKSRLSQSNKNIEQTNSDLETSRSKINEFKTIQKNESGKIQTLQKQKIEISAKIEELLKQKSEWDTKNKECELNLQKIRESQSQLSEILHQVEIDLRTHENEKKNIIKRLEESYQISPEQAKEQITPKEVGSEEIFKLRKRVESMSNSVNLEAPEQYQHLQERYEFLNTQTQDLVKAREDLKNALKQINLTTKEQFRENFIKVRENFRAIYSTLFTGGEADLIFTDETDLLNTGIDIVAQPPGKKLQNIALLSGGEKALTAIALLFAFFMVKPSPFCVLDEVDAPWDPANVARFLNLLKEFAKKTQFLIVTHNPRTMEIADILYGVTMEEAGISKILSAKLKKEPKETSETSLAAASASSN